MSGGLFDIAPLTGAIGVVTINLAYLGCEHEGDEVALMDDFEATAREALEGLHNKRVFLDEALKNGLYPHVSQQIESWDTYYSVVSICGANELCLNFSHGEYGVADPRGKALALKLLRRLRAITDAEDDLTGVEMAPCEGASGRMARHMLEQFPNALVSGAGGQVYLTNGTQLPAGHEGSVWDIAEHQQDFHPLYNSGVAQHLYIASGEEDAEAVRKTIPAVFKNYSLTHVTWNPSYSACPKCGRIEGHHEVCPTCGGPATAFERVLGYYRPMASFNPGKQGEFLDRFYL